MIILNSAAGSGSSTLIMFGLIFAVMYFFMIRPQVKKQRKEREYRDALKKGEHVVTIGGIHAKIVDVKKDCFILETHDGSKIKVQKTAVSMGGVQTLEKK